MNRRAFIGTLAGGLLAAPLAAEAQAPQKVPRVGYLSNGSASDPRRVALLGAFQQGLRDVGYVAGKNIIIEARFAEGNYDRLPALAADLVRLKVDIIVAYSTPATQAAQKATRTIPIVMTTVVDPVATGLLVGLGRPGGKYYRPILDGPRTHRETAAATERGSSTGLPSRVPDQSEQSRRRTPA